VRKRAADDSQPTQPSAKCPAQSSTAAASQCKAPWQWHVNTMHMQTGWHCVLISCLHSGAHDVCCSITLAALTKEYGHPLTAATARCLLPRGGPKPFPPAAPPPAAAALIALHAHTAHHLAHPLTAATARCLLPRGGPKPFPPAAPPLAAAALTALHAHTAHHLAHPLTAATARCLLPRGGPKPFPPAAPPLAAAALTALHAHAAHLQGLTEAGTCTARLKTLQLYAHMESSRQFIQQCRLDHPAASQN
jgi:hypothetical protein